MNKFTKMQGLGNDYLYISTVNDENFISEEKLPELAKYLSNRHFGVGSDGIIIIEKSNIADFKMRIFNSDGSEAEMCGNGIRCFAKYVYENKLTQNKNISIETLCGIKKVTLEEKDGIINNVTVDMGEPIFEKEKIPVLFDERKVNKNETVQNDKNKNKIPVTINLKVLDKIFNINCVSMGNPHSVIIVENVEKIDIAKYGKEIENNSVFPKKTNVEFVQILDKENIKMRVWERGSGETMACGTGACAVAVICNLLGLTKRKVNVLLRGGKLKIQWKKENHRVYMTGSATKVFIGKINEILP